MPIIFSANSGIVILLLIILSSCATQITYNNVSFDSSNIENGKINVIVENKQNSILKVPESIDNNALIISEFQRLIKEGSMYSNVRHQIVQFDFFKFPCFPLNEKLKPGESKIYQFAVFNYENLEGNSEYRIKVVIDNFLIKNGEYYKSDWIYFKKN